jgi:hypothetical protein
MEVVRISAWRISQLTVKQVGPRFHHEAGSGVAEIVKAHGGQAETVPNQPERVRQVGGAKGAALAHRRKDPGAGTGVRARCVVRLKHAEHRGHDVDRCRGGLRLRLTHLQPHRPYRMSGAPRCASARPCRPRGHPSEARRSQRGEGRRPRRGREPDRGGAPWPGECGEGR